MQTAPSPSLSYCIANGRAVLLDLSTDRYSALPPQADLDFQRLLAGEPVQPEGLKQLDDLLGHDFVASISPPSDSCKRSQDMPAQAGPQGTVYPLRLIPVLDALARRIAAERALRAGSLGVTVARIKARKAAVAAPILTLPADRDLADFLHTRRWLPAQDRCLSWSVALVDYLAARGSYPDLVLGVKMKPFAAHAWVQTGPRVLNDDPETVAAYTPILVA